MIIDCAAVEGQADRPGTLVFKMMVHGCEMEFTLLVFSETRRFKEVETAIEHKRKSKILLVTAHVNTLELLEMFDNNNLFI